MDYHRWSSTAVAIDSFTWTSSSHGYPRNYQGGLVFVESRWLATWSARHKDHSLPNTHLNRNQSQSGSGTGHESISDLNVEFGLWIVQRLHAHDQRYVTNCGNRTTQKTRTALSTSGEVNTILSQCIGLSLAQTLLVLRLFRSVPHLPMCTSITTPLRW